MNDYLIIPNIGKWKKVKAKSAEMAYRNICCWYTGNVMIMDIKTGHTEMFQKEWKEPGIAEIKKGDIYHE